MSRPDSWQPEEEEFLRHWYTEAPLADLCAHLGRSNAAIKSKARMLGIRKREFWTDEEAALLVELHLTHTAEQIAARLPGRTIKSIQQQAKKLGLLKLPRLPRDLVESVRQLHAEGLTDTAIARRLGRDRRSISALRDRRLRLPQNQEAVLEAKRRGVRTQYARLGIETAGQLRALAFRRYAAENGWPEDLRPRAVQILNLLAAAGVPLPRRLLRDLIVAECIGGLSGSGTLGELADRLDAGTLRLDADDLELLRGMIRAARGDVPPEAPATELDHDKIAAVLGSTYSRPNEVDAPPPDAPEGEPWLGGLTNEIVQRAYVAAKLASHPKPPGKLPHKVDAFEDGGRLWVVTGMGDTAVDILPLIPVREFEERYPGYATKYLPAPTLHYDREGMLQLYTGVIVKVGRKEYAICPAGEGRTLIRPKEKTA